LKGKKINLKTIIMKVLQLIKRYIKAILVFIKELPAAAGSASRS
jgi:hypothetical protein